VGFETEDKTVGDFLVSIGNFFIFMCSLTYIMNVIILREGSFLLECDAVSGEFPPPRSEGS